MLIATTNSKGGVGKSTLAVHLATWLNDQGQTVLVLDCDMQQSSSRWLQRVAPEIRTQWLTSPDDVFEQALELTQAAEVVIADGPAGLAELTRALLMVADVALVPCAPSGLDVEASMLAVKVIQQARVIRKDNLPRALFVPNKLQPNTRLSQELLESSEKLDIPVVKTPLRLRTVYADAPGQGLVVWQMGYRAKEAIADMRALCEEVMSYAQGSQTAHRSRRT